MDTARGEARDLGQLEERRKAARVHFAIARRYLKRQLGETTKATAAPKMKRQKSCQWVAMLENALACVGVALKDFRVPADKLKDASDCLSWKLLGVASDKGPDAVCGSSFLSRCVQLNMDTWWDPSHGAWRACLNALADCGLAIHNMLMVMAYNVGFGEWKDGSRWEQIRTSVIDTATTGTPEVDDVFQYVLPGICRDRGLDPSCVDEHGEREIYASLADGGCWRTIYPKISQSRFFGVLKRFEDVEAHCWRERVYGLINCCIDLGFLETPSSPAGQRTSAGEGRDCRGQFVDGRLVAPASADAERRQASCLQNQEGLQRRLSCLHCVCRRRESIAPVGHRHGRVALASVAFVPKS